MSSGGAGDLLRELLDGAGGDPQRALEALGARYLATLSLLSERDATIARLRADQERLRLAVGAANMGIWEWDVVTGKVTWSEELFDILRVPEDTTPGVDAWLAAMHPEDREWASQRLRDVIEDPSQDRWALDHRFVSGTSEVRWVQCRGVVVRDEHGRGLSIRGTCVDVTERKRIEEQLLHNQKLESVGRLAGGVAHDFNNLLTVIFASIEAVRRRARRDTATLEPLVEAEHAAQRAQALTEQLLSFARKQSVTLREVVIDELVRAVAPLLRRLLPSGVELELELDAAPWQTWIDSGRFEQVIINLVVNARDAMRGQGVVRIATARDAGDDAVVLRVSDTGPGIPPEVGDQVFEPFFTTKESGTGLGLATCYGTVQSFGGTIRLDSAPGQGTVFTICLPRADGAAPDHRDPVEASDSGPAAATETPVRVLVVEDSEMLRSVCVNLLRDAGFEVIAAADAADAKRLFREHTVDVVFTDVVMPGESGIELAEALRRDDAGVSVVFASGYADVPPADGEIFLAKPYAPDELVETIRRAARR